MKEAGPRATGATKGGRSTWADADQRTRADRLVLDDLGVALPGTDGGHQTVLDGVDLEVCRGEVVVLLGPSGAGKSTLVSALLGLLPTGSLVRGRATWRQDGEEHDLLDPGARARERQRGRLAAWLPQAPLATMTPVLTVGQHLHEKARVHARAKDSGTLLDRALDRHDVERSWLRRLPSQLSGGQAQRVSNALSLLGDPGLVLADEPTTGLDRARARRTGEQLRVLARDEGRAVLVVTHDLVLAAQIADTVVVLDAGRVGQPLSSRDLALRMRQARHDLVPHRSKAAREGATTGQQPATGTAYRSLSGVGLTLVRGRGHVVREGLDFQVPSDRTTGLVAPSGAGKTTLLRTLALLHAPARGHVDIDGRPVQGSGHRVPATVRRRIGYVQQDPRSAVDPRWTLGRTIAEPLRLGGLPHDGAVLASLLDRVGLEPGIAARRPDEVSGGQLQRVVLARALALEPDYLLLDEPTSMVDAATARAAVAAVHQHQHATGCGVLVASHDEELLRTWCDQVIRWES